MNVSWRRWMVPAVAALGVLCLSPAAEASGVVAGVGASAALNAEFPVPGYRVDVGYGFTSLDARNILVLRGSVFGFVSTPPVFAAGLHAVWSFAADTPSLFLSAGGGVLVPWRNTAHAGGFGEGGLGVRIPLEHDRSALVGGSVVVGFGPRLQLWPGASVAFSF